MSLDAFPRGVLVPAVTPFHADLSVDAERFVDHCRWLLSEGASGLAVFGTTSEANALSIAERTDLLERLIASGIGSYTIELSSLAALGPRARALLNGAPSVAGDGFSLTRR